MEWNKLLSPRRKGEYARSANAKSTDLRSEFEKDYHRIIGSASFRRLQDKTQVFPLDKSDFIRTRLTHSLEVSSLAKSLGQNIAEHILQNQLDRNFNYQTKEDMSDILQCAGLIHDIGNPPFGHFGEEAIREWFVKNLHKITYGGRPVTEVLTKQMTEDFYHFEGNAQALRLVSKLHFLVNENGMNLTYALLNSIIKYPVASTGIRKDSGNIKDKKMGYYFSEQELFRKITSETGAGNNRHPLTYILEAADDIAYRTADIEDAFKKGCISYEYLLEQLHRLLDGYYKDGINYPIQVLTRQYQKAIDNHFHAPELYAVQNWLVRMQGSLIYSATQGFINNYQEIMEGRFRYNIFHGSSGSVLIKALGRIAYECVFISTPILKLEIAAGKIIDFLLEKFVLAFLVYDTDYPIGIMETKIISLISENYKQIYHTYSKGRPEPEKLYLRLLLVTDYICGMTDSFAKSMYQELNGID